MNKPFASHPLRAAQQSAPATVVSLNDYRQRKMTQLVEGLNQWLVTGDQTSSTESQS